MTTGPRVRIDEAGRLWAAQPDSGQDAPEWCVADADAAIFDDADVADLTPAVVLTVDDARLLAAAANPAAWSTLTADLRYPLVDQARQAIRRLIVRREEQP